jgi:hypothetical protein
MTLTYDLHYDIDSDYKTAFTSDVSALISAVIMPREARILAVQMLIDAYVRDIGKSPDSAQLERLADALLYEELTDTHPDKVTNAEYPFMSERQFERRYEREYSIDLAENYDTEGVNQSKPDRRHRTAKEHRFVDKLALAKNRRRNAAYKRDTSAGPIITYSLRFDMDGELTPEFVDCIGTSDHMRRMADRLVIV